MNKTHYYGYIPDLMDQRDFKYKAQRGITVPKIVDLRSKCPPIVDQGQISSCTANAIASAIQFDAMQQKTQDMTPPSRLFIYYNERVIEHSVKSDAGAMIRDGIKSVAKIGVCDESLWTYSDDGVKLTKKPPVKCYKNANRKALLYQSLDNSNLDILLGCLAANNPFIFGFTVYESFESPSVAKTGIVQMPSSNDRVLGGHATLCVGFNKDQKRFIVRNSWGLRWGQEGHFTISFDYLTNTNLANDFWTIKTIQD